MSRIHFHDLVHDTGVTLPLYFLFNCSEIGLQCHTNCTFMEAKFNALFSLLAYLLPLPCVVVFIGSGFNVVWATFLDSLQLQVSCLWLLTILYNFSAVH
jgi:hypothetical protein